MTTMKLSENLVAMIVDGQVDITDPCYNRGEGDSVWGQNVSKGLYFVRTFEGKEGRTSAIWMAKRKSVMDTYLSVEDIKSVCEVKREAIGVDSGLCGFFTHKKNYDRKEWMDFCEYVSTCDMIFNATSGADAAPLYYTDNGAFSGSGYGDGCYDLYTHKDGKGEVDGIAVVFMEE